MKNKDKLQITNNYITVYNPLYIPPTNWEPIPKPAPN